MNYNNLTLFVYNSSSQLVAGAGLEYAEELLFSTIYPGGVFESCSFFVPRSPGAYWPVQPAQRLVIRNGMKIVWEGRIVSIAPSFDQIRMGFYVECVGYWGDVLMNRKWRHIWADTRTDEQAWAWDVGTAVTGASICMVDRNNRIMFSPNPVSWGSAVYAQCKYTAPSGDTIKRVTGNYDFSEGTQNWVLGLWNTAGGTALWTVTATGTGSFDTTVSPASGTINLYMQSGTTQTATGGGTIYGKVTSLTVYGESGTITLTEIAKDVAGTVSDLSVDYQYIATNAYSIVPFISEVDSLADILMNAAGYSDASFNSWAVGIRESTLGTDSKPVLFAETYPGTTSADYVVNASELGGEFSAFQDIASIRNWIAVQYRDSFGRAQFVTPDDDSSLKDTTSISTYGRRDEWLDLDTTDVTRAKNAAARYLAARKNPQWTVTSSIDVVGAIRTTSGGLVPVSEVRAGGRLKIENWLGDVSSSGLIFLITGTTYDDYSQTLSLSVGQSSMIDNMLANLSRVAGSSRKSGQVASIQIDPFLNEAPIARVPKPPSDGEGRGFTPYTGLKP